MQNVSCRNGSSKFASHIRGYIELAAFQLNLTQTGNVTSRNRCKQKKLEVFNSSNFINLLDLNWCTRDRGSRYIQISVRDLQRKVSERRRYYTGKEELVMFNHVPRYRIYGSETKLHLFKTSSTMDSGQLRVPAALPWVRSQRIHWTVGSVCVVTGVDVVQVKVKVSRDRPRWPKGFRYDKGSGFS